MGSAKRLSTGVSGLDERLGGGLLSGTLTVVVGATGVGKTQLGLQFAHQGVACGEQHGILFDMSARLDSQGHADYAARMFDWSLTCHAHRAFSPVDYFTPERAPGSYLHVFDERGQRVTQRDMGFDAWHDWQAELASKLNVTIDFFYGNFVRGARRVVIDGIEPAERPSESIQFELFEYIYHQILRKDADWVARDLFREAFRAHADQVQLHHYDRRDLAAMLLVTSHEAMLDNLIERPLVDGDVLAAANTLIYMGKVRQGDRLARGLFIAKHRGSACSDEIARYTIGDAGIAIG